MKTKPFINKYIDPMVDFGFKKIFKESGKKNLIIRPLNAIFGLDIVDIDIRDSEQLGLTEEERKASYDMFCTTTDGSQFIVEVQLAKQDFFMERADPARFIHRFSLREDETHEQMSRVLRFAFLEIERFDKPQEDCNTFEDRFLYMMKNLPTFAEKPQLWDDDYFEEMMEEAEFANMTLEQRMQYALAMKHKWDYQNTIDYARKEGREEGREQQAVETARRLLELGLPVETIALGTGLSEEQVREL